ncbi:MULTISPECIES: hypothetical protein [unclassified Streptosporangium]|uniref:hypothetical protein n=1 Tax=unclassified Streptosporangium TaxID=2632669 RepID=UPI002E2BC95C|nr:MULTISPECIES: hypothetical protein [unclassified Streptosporangium]
MRVRSVLSVAALAGGLALLWQPLPSSAGQDSVVAADTVEYECTTDGVTEKQTIEIDVEMTMPTGVTTGQPFTIGWRGTYIGTGLTAPAAGLPEGTKLYAYASISNLPGLTSATGVGTLDAVSAGQSIPLPTASISLAATSSNPGTAAVRPAAINFGTLPTNPLIECESLNRDTLTTYPLTVAAGGQATDPAPTDTATQPVGGTETDEDAGTGETTETPQDANGEIAETPAGGADTGGGGETGPDGRALVLTGSLITFGAVTGLLLRRRGGRTVVNPRA